MKSSILFSVGLLFNYSCTHPTALCDTYYDSKEKMYDYVQCNGELIKPARYTLAHEFTEGGISANYLEGRGWLYIDRSGNSVVAPFIYDNGPDYFSQGLSRFIDNEKIGFIDKSGSIVIPAIYDMASPFTDGFSKVGFNCRKDSHGEHTITKCEDTQLISLPE